MLLYWNEDIYDTFPSWRALGLRPRTRHEGSISQTPEGQVNNMLFFQLVRFSAINIYISSLFYENMHSNGLRDPGGKAVADSLSTWHSDLFYKGGTVTKA